MVFVTFNEKRLKKAPKKLGRYSVYESIKAILHNVSCKSGKKNCRRGYLMKEIVGLMRT